MRQGSGCRGFRAGVVRGFSAFSRLLRSAVWLQGGAGPQPSLFPDPTGAGPAKASWPPTAVTWKAASPATTCPTLRDTPLETLAQAVGSRWRIETGFETEKSDVGFDEYEMRTWADWHHHVALCLLAGASLLSLHQAWKEEDAAAHEAAGVPGGLGDAARVTVRAG